MKTLKSTKSKTQPGEGGVGVGSSRAGREGSKLDGSELYDGEVDGGEVDGSEVDGSEVDGGEVDGSEVEVNEVGKKVQKCKNLSKSKKAVRSDFLTPGARLAFTKLRQVFVKALILHHFNPERYIRIEMDTSGYAIGGVLSQLTLDDLGRWHPMALFSWKMISAEIRYKTHDGELLAIIEAFKTWRHYLKSSEHEVLMPTNYNNLRQFMNMKSLSSRQVRWAQELSCYHFRIDYRQGKANGAADALFWYPQRSAKEEKALQAENIKILHRLHSSLAKVSGLSTSQLSSFHQIFICGTIVLPQLNQFWNSFWEEIALDSPYIANIGGMRLQLFELQENNKEAKLFRESSGLPEGWEDVKRVLQYQKLSYVPAIIRFKVINCHHNDLLIGHFGIDKTRELVGWKYYWPSLRRDVESYVWGCDICLASKIVRQKPYRDLQSLPVPTHQWKDLSIDFVTGLSLSADWKSDSYDLILVIVDQLTKMVHFKPVKVTIDALGLAEVILDVVVWHHGLQDSIVTNKGSLITSKFWSSLCYFFGIKQRLSTAFHPQTDGQTEWQNSTMEAYLWVFINFEQNNWARLLLIAEFAYNNAKNASTGHTLFELNYGYYPRMLYKEDVDPRSQSKSADKLSAELRKLMIVCQENFHHTQEL